MAEGEGFEPPVRFPVQWFSRPPVSTAHTTLRGREADIYILRWMAPGAPVINSARRITGGPPPSRSTNFVIENGLELVEVS